MCKRKPMNEGSDYDLLCINCGEYTMNEFPELDLDYTKVDDIYYIWNLENTLFYWGRLIQHEKYYKM